MLWPVKSKAPSGVLVTPSLDFEMWARRHLGIKVGQSVWISSEFSLYSSSLALAFEMAFTSLLFAAFAALLVNGAPASDTTTKHETIHLESSDDPTVAYALITMCNNANFGGSCVTWTGNLNTCYNLNEYDNAVSSARPATTGIYCVLYDNYVCTGAGPIISGPAYNLNDQGYNDRASSFYCYFD